MSDEEFIQRTVNGLAESETEIIELKEKLAIAVKALKDATHHCVDCGCPMRLCFSCDGRRSAEFR